MLFRVRRLASTLKALTTIQIHLTSSCYHVKFDSNTDPDYDMEYSITLNSKFDSNAWEFHE